MILWQSHFFGPFLHNKILCFHLCWNTLYWERQNRTWFYKFFEIIFWSVQKHKKRCQDFSWHRSDCANFVSTGHKVSSSHQYSWLIPAVPLFLKEPSEGTQWHQSVHRLWRARRHHRFHRQQKIYPDLPDFMALWCGWRKGACGYPCFRWCHILKLFYEE